MKPSKFLRGYPPSSGIVTKYSVLASPYIISGAVVGGRTQKCLIKVLILFLCNVCECRSGACGWDMVYIALEVPGANERRSSKYFV